MPADPKSMLREAQKELDDNKLVEMAVKDEFGAVLEDAEACDKARRQYEVALQKGKGSVSVLEKSQSLHVEKIKALNDGLTTVKRMESAMKLPADQAAYKKLVTDYTSAIAKSMDLSKQSAAALAKAKGLVK